MMQTFVCSTRLYFGDDALGVLGTLNVQRALIVTDRFFVENGTAARIAGFMTGAKTETFSEVQPDPPLEVVAKGVQVLQHLQPDTMIALGGGSAIDCAKGILSMGGLPVRLIAIPTTSGTGSEVTSFAILSHGGTKHPLVEESLRPQIAILDESLLQQLPQSLIADAGMDVLAHCLEALTAKNASPFTQAFAMSAFRTVMEKLTDSFEGRQEVRGQIHLAATMAGIAFDNAGLGVCHALSHALGGAFHTPHGRLNAILLPHVIAFNAEKDPRPYASLATYCGLHGVRALSFALTRLRRQLKLPATLTEAGIDRGAVLREKERLCAAALADPCAATNPRPVTLEGLRGLLQAAL